MAFRQTQHGIKKMKKQLFAILVLLTSLTFAAEEDPKLAGDLIALAGVTEVKFFFLPDVPAEKIKPLNAIAIQSLKKMGTVIPKALNVQNPTEGMNDPNSSFKSPSLIYTIEKIKDLKGNFLPVSMATLELKAGVTIDRSKDYIQTDLWKKECFIQLDLAKNTDITVKDTLAYLLKEFDKDLIEAKKKKNNKLVFYFAE